MPPTPSPSLRDGFPDPLSAIGGFVAGPDGDGAIRAASVLLDARTLDVLAGELVCLPAAATRASDAPASRELAALLAALEALPHAPDLALVHGDGIAHPQGMGIAARFGVAAGLPSIGVARSLLYGTGPEPHETRGAYTALRDPTRRQLGWLLRSRPGHPPLVVSPGHRVALASAADLVMRFTRGDRLPEPLRLADRLVRGGDPEESDGTELQAPKA